MPEQLNRHPLPGQLFPWAASSPSWTATGAPSSTPSCGATKPSSPAARPAAGAYTTLGSSSSTSRAERRCSRSRTTLRNQWDASSTRTRRCPLALGASRPPRPAPAYRYNTRAIVLSVSCMLRAPWGDNRDTLLHDAAHAIHPMATGTTTQPTADLSPPPRAGSSFHPPAHPG